MLARLLVAGAGALLLTAAVAVPASAHGAPLDPVSRSVACGSQGDSTRTAACTAARSGSEGQWYTQWDNVRVANVNGRDRQVIPDGHLCSGGIDGFAGLDLARSDWPSTRVRAGKVLTIRYRGTIPHQGSFRMYVSKDGYDPKRPLRWADLEAKPFVTVTDPGFSRGAYRFRATLPTGKVGRHVLYTVWQNSSTADTYYSCSDVVFTAATKAPAAGIPTTGVPTDAVPTSAVPTDAVPTSAVPADAAATAGGRPSGRRGPPPAVRLDPAENLSAPEDDDSLRTATLVTASGLLALIGTCTAVVVVARRRRQTGPLG